jgi:hypothetical protein
MFWLHYFLINLSRRLSEWNRQRAIHARNRAFHRLEMSFVYEVAVRGRGYSQEWKMNHVRLALAEYGIDVTEVGYLDESGQIERLDEETWVARIVGLSECFSK